MRRACVERMDGDGTVSQVVERGSRRIASDRGLAERTQPKRMFCLPAVQRRKADSLLNQQFWLWGQDIRRREDNLLLSYGFTRLRPPADIQGSNRYVLRLDDHRVVVLWGFGFFYGLRDRGGVYISRTHLAPLITPGWEPPADVWQPSDVPPYRSPEGPDDWSRISPLLVDALQWISAYESRILDELGAEYRQACLADWKRPVCSACEIPERWLCVARQYEDTLRQTMHPLPLA